MLSHTLGNLCIHALFIYNFPYRKSIICCHTHESIILFVYNFSHLTSFRTLSCCSAPPLQLQNTLTQWEMKEGLHLYSCRFPYSFVDHKHCQNYFMTYIYCTVISCIFSCCRIWKYLINNPDWEETFPKLNPRGTHSASQGHPISLDQRSDIKFECKVFGALRLAHLWSLLESPFPCGIVLGVPHQLLANSLKFVCYAWLVGTHALGQKGMRDS